MDLPDGLDYYGHKENYPQARNGRGFNSLNGTTILLDLWVGFYSVAIKKYKPQARNGMVIIFLNEKKLDLAPHYGPVGGIGL